MSIELPVATRHRRDMTEKLLKATLNPNSHTHTKNRRGVSREWAFRVLINSKFGVFSSNFLSLTPIFCKVSVEKYSKTPTFSGREHFYSYFQNPSENSDKYSTFIITIELSTYM